LGRRIVRSADDQRELDLAADARQRLCRLAAEKVRGFSSTVRAEMR
jgi:hypothetical protein